MNLLRFIFIIITLCCSFLLSGQQTLVDIQQLTPKDGLANLYTSAIFQDKQGFIWVGTEYGLNRYDGYDFKLFTKEKNGLYNNSYIYQIAKGKQDNLWLFYKVDNVRDKFFNPLISHIDIFDTKTGKTYDFETYYKGKLPFRISDILCIRVNDAQKKSWIVTKSGGLFLLKNNQFIKVFQSKNKTITAVTIDEKDNIFIGANKQLIQTNFSKSKQSITNFSKTIINIWVEGESKIWLTTRSFLGSKKPFTIFSKSYNRNDIKEFHHFNIETVSSFDNNHVKIHKFGQYWLIIEMNEAYIINSKKEKIKDLSHLLNRDIQIDPYNIWANQDMIWIGTPSGILKVNIRCNSIRIIHKRETLSDCRGITEDNKGNIYFNNSQGHKYNPISNTVELFRDINGNFFAHYYDNKVLSGLYSNKDLIVISDLITKKNHIVPAINRLALSIIETHKKNELLIGTDKGLIFFNSQSYVKRDFTRYNQFDILKTTDINAMKRQGENIWLSTNKGIFLMTEKEGILQHFSQASGDLPFDFIQHLHIDKAGVFWLATKGHGLIRWQLALGENQKSETKQFTIDDGLSHNYLYAVYEDDFNNLWLSSDYGIMKLNKETQQIQTFTTNNGLLHDEFNKFSHYKAKNGTLYFGGLGGLIAIHPEDFANQKINKIPLAFTSLSVLEGNKEVFIDKTDLIQKSNILRLKPSDKLIEIRFALLSFTGKDDQMYAYKIEGYTNRWIYSNENFIRITNLPYGTYQLKIKGKTSSQSWSNSELNLTIKILKPFYLKWWFIFLCAITIVGIVLIINQKRIQGLKDEKERLTVEVKKRTAKIETDKFIIEQQAEDLKALDIAKTKFFSNITHEFRTPLTLIAGPTQLLAKQNLPKSIQTHLNIVGKNASHLLDLVNQLLDLSKLEVGKMSVELVRYDIILFTKELIDQLKPLADNKGQVIDFQIIEKEWTTIFDKNKWQKIIFNLLSNAIKFTPNNGQITIELSEKMIYQKANIYLAIKDNGIGISTESQAYIFNRFHQVDNSDIRSQQGTGIGLALVKELISLQNGEIFVESKIGMGTTFSVNIPVENDETVNPKPIEPTIFSFNNTNPIAPEIVPIFNNKDCLRLLIIEDNADIRTYIKSCIDVTIFEIIEAENGAIGIEKAIESVPDLIISDIMMPEKDGFEVTKAVRQNAITSHIPIVLLTAKTALESRLEGIKRGADVYLTKPFSPEELVLRIYKLIELRQLLQQRYTAINKADTTKNTAFEIEDKFVIAFKTYILDNLAEPNLDGETLAKKFLMSRMQLYRKIKALTNQSTSEYIRNLRLETALNLLKKKELTIAEIAYQTGFSSPSHFTKAFKKYYEKLPSDI
jgi:signal transduction histidine kinase/DNA-binding response OmpR family regulator/ligand-binding sensor domain-containing protein